jgi:hypothetical protein
MTLFECPYCQRKAGSFWSFGNSAYFFSTKKKCPHCTGRIMFNATSLFITFLLEVVSFILVFGLTFLLYREIKGVGVLIPILAVVFGLFFSLLSICVRYFKLRLYLPKDDVKNHMDNLPSYLKGELSGTSGGSIRDIRK